MALDDGRKDTQPIAPNRHDMYTISQYNSLPGQICYRQPSKSTDTPENLPVGTEPITLGKLETEDSDA